MDNIMRFSPQTKLIELNKNYRKKILYLIIATVLSYILIMPDNIMWAKDRFYYLEYARSSYLILRNNLDQGIITFLSNEPLFLVINFLLSYIFTPENTVRILILFSYFLFLYSFGKYSDYNLLLIIIFFLSPQVMLKYIVHLRQGLAMSLYYFSLFSNNHNKRIKYVKLLTPFIHSSMFFILFFEIVEFLLRKFKFDVNVRLILSILIFILVMTFIRDIAYLIGDRRAAVYSNTLGINGVGLGFIYWFFLGTIIILFSNRTYYNILCFYGIIFYIISYFYLEYSARVFESMYPLILATGILDNKKWYRYIFFSFSIIYIIGLWFQGGFFNFLN